MAKGKEVSGACEYCPCPHHKWMLGLAIVATGGVLLYTGSWAWTIIALGVLTLLGGNLCKCCNGSGGMCGCC